jgi:hypothetical protein
MRVPYQKLLATLLLGGVFAATVRAEEAPAPGAKVLAEAQRNLANCKQTTYQHKTEIDEAQGRYNCDCSAFVSHVLKRMAPEALAAIPSTGKGHPLAVDYFECVAAAPALGEANAKGAFRKIQKFGEALPGDIVAWRKEELVKGDTTGHVMILAEKPVREANGEFRTVVIDSTSKIHAEDTRKEGETGLGRGTLWVKVDEQGAAVGMRISAPKGTLNSHALDVGRLVEAK